MIQYQLSDQEVKAIKEECKDPEMVEHMMEVTLQGKISWIEDHIPPYPPRTIDGRDIGLDEIRAELEKETGLIRVE